jgi:hypothetical protein
MQFEYRGVHTIISGGQTGADRAGLEVARKFSIATGGVAPLGYRTQAGSDLSLQQFGLSEDTTTNYASRTKKNVLLADATLVFSTLPVSTGSALTINLCIAHQKPYLLVPLPVIESPTAIVEWIEKHQVRVLNIAGNRQRAIGTSSIYEICVQVLTEVLFSLRDKQLLVITDDRVI